jgi:hypothetical protein
MNSDLNSQAENPRKAKEEAWRPMLQSLTPARDQEPDLETLQAGPATSGEGDENAQSAKEFG